MTLVALVAFVAAAVAACALVVVALRVADRPALRRTNFRGATVSLVAAPVCVAVLVAGGVATGVVALAVAALLAGVAGTYDDLRGDATAKGLAGHLGALVRGRVTSGAVKVLVVGVAGVVAALLLYGLTARGALAAVLVAGTANLLNLFDLRPGRAAKVALLVTLPLLTPAAYVVAGTAAGLLPSDLRERTMLGDGGANALGAAAGVALAERLPFAGAIVAAGVVVALTLASEAVSFSRVIDGVAPLRWADRLGRAA
ncbi:MAG TPA: hypothetical protein VNA20_13570 [Frankiaceae bacterium]|nr:hypothetical protein [Frankiaceae bacterium]